MKLNKLYIASIASSIALTGAGQTLSSEVKVEHEVLPTSTDAPRLDISPALNLPPVSFKPLTYSASTVSAPITPQITRLEPTAWADTIYTSPYKGYAMLGYFPLYNLEASAGYRFLDNDHTRLSGWLQMNGHSYGSDNHKYDRNTMSIGADLHQAIGKKSFIDAGIGYTIDGFNVPLGDIPADAFERRNQLVNRLSLAGTWSSSVGQMKYNAGLSYKFFGFRNQVGSDLSPDYYEWLLVPPVREHDIDLFGSVSMPFSSISSIGADLKLSTVSTTTSSSVTYIQDTSLQPFVASYEPDQNFYRGLYHPESENKNLAHALLSVAPYYSFKTKNISGRLGAVLDFTFNRGTVFHVAPAVEITWLPIKWLAIHGEAKGGVTQNTTSKLFDINFAMNPGLIYRNSYVPVDILGSVTVGPWKGCFVEGYFRWAKANDWLMPAISTSSTSLFYAHDITSWIAGVKLGAEYRDMAKITFKAEMTSGAYDKGWYQWADRAKYVMGASLLVKPIKKLQLTADYELRACRRIMDRHTFVNPEPRTYETYIPLRNISDLSLGGLYEFTDRLSLFLQLNNLMSRSPRYVSGMEMQRFHGLLGATYKF